MEGQLSRLTMSHEDNRILVDLNFVAFSIHKDYSNPNKSQFGHLA